LILPGNAFGNNYVGPLLQNSERSGQHVFFLLSSPAIIPQNLVFYLGFVLRRSAFCTAGLRDSFGAPKVHPMGVAPELRVDCCGSFLSFICAFSEVSLILILPYALEVSM
jgi:hypothetical protein